MEGTNALGKKVDLLNHDVPPSFLARLSIHSRSSSFCIQSSQKEEPKSFPFRSLTSSAATATHPTTTRRLPSPRISPTSTPQLVRFDSSSSQSSLQTPSPMTPTYPYEPLEQQQQQHQQKLIAVSDPYYRLDGPYYSSTPPMQQSLMDVSQQPFYTLPLQKTDDLLLDDGLYPPLADLSLPTPFNFTAADLNAAAAIPISIPVTQQLSAPTTILPVAENIVATENKASTPPPKKKYPCPHASRFGCNDTFTTSGHAARHGKKHTGEKNIHCPTCNKAFTRKDNMKQHERTHKTNPDSIPSSTTKSSGTSATTSAAMAEMKENHSAARKRQKVARARNMSQSIASTSEITADDDDDDGDEDIEEPIAAAPLKRSVRPSMRRASIHESIANSRLHLDVAPSHHSRPVFDRQMSGSSQDGEGESPGLDVLAIACSGMQASGM
ncbi:Zinc finger and SCAN domain-containing protein 5B [Agyrium rufum]|nr:Zinc finger and SCAN domain-containing protein 5B [Agyrium rufum]